MIDDNRHGGPLCGTRVIEFASMGPGPFAGMMLSDMGAEVIQITRSDAAVPQQHQNHMRGRKRIPLDLKRPEAIDECLRLIARADVLIEGYRPGAMERRGLGPDIALNHNPALIYGRMTGWGQTGPLAETAGHDINYLALTGLAHAIGPAERPVAPLNLCTDYGGGAMFLVAGILAALLHARATGQGQVIDAAMTDCTAYLGSLFHGMQAAGLWADRREANFLDGGAHFYGNYACADGKFVAVGSLEPAFYAILLERTGAISQFTGDQMDAAQWPTMRQKLGEIFRTRTRDEWCEIFQGSDACVSPVLTLAEARSHPHMEARQVFVECGGHTHVAPVPRFSATPMAIQSPPAERAWSIDEIMADWSGSEATA